MKKLPLEISAWFFHPHSCGLAELSVRWLTLNPEANDWMKANHPDRTTSGSDHSSRSGLERKDRATAPEKFSSTHPRFSIVLDVGS